MSHCRTRHAMCVQVSVSAAVLAMGICGVAGRAGAQTAAGSSTGPTAPSSTEATTADIVVTAQRRSESIQKTPLAIQALTGQQLAAAGVSDVSSLQTGIPGFHVTQGGVLPQLAIRGVGSNQVNAFGEPDISFSVDDIYEGKASALSGGFFDVARVEVLKGPQGTLYGRNAVGGVVNVITNDPTFTASASAEVEAGNYGLFQGTGILNVPVSDTVAVRAAIQSVRHDGYLSSGYDDADNISGRVRLLWKPSDTVTIHLAGDYFHQGGRGWTDVITPVVNLENPWQQSFSAYTGTDGYSNNRNWGVMGRLDWTIGNTILTIIPAYRSSRTDLKTYATGQMNLFQIDGQQRTIETRLASDNNGPLKWLVGLFALSDSSPAHQLYQKSATAPYYSTQAVDLSRNNSTSLAAFAEATYSLTNWFRATAGVRETHDRKSIAGTSVISTIVTPTAPPLPTSTIPLNNQAEWNRFNWKLGLDADIGTHSLIYFNASTGYKSGGFYTAAAPNDYGPEEITAFSLGSKNRLLGGRLLLNVELFDWEYHDKQVSTFIPQPPPVTVLFATINAGRARIRGADIDAVFDITTHDHLSGTLEYLDAKFTRFHLAATALSAARDLDGYPLPLAPTWSGTIAFQHDQPLASGGTLSFRVQSHLVSDQWLDLQYIPQQLQGGYHKTDVSIRYNAPEDRWYVEAYGRNLENSAVFTSAASTGKPYIFGSIEPPRTWGVKLGAKF